MSKDFFSENKHCMEILLMIYHCIILKKSKKENFSTGSQFWWSHHFKWKMLIKNKIRKMGGGYSKSSLTWKQRDLDFSSVSTPYRLSNLSQSLLPNLSFHTCTLGVTNARPQRDVRCKWNQVKIWKLESHSNVKQYYNFPFKLKNAE